MRSSASGVVTGVIVLSASVPGSPPGATRASLAMRERPATSSSPIPPTPTATEPARQRWPALEKAEAKTAGTARSRSASGITTRWFLAPASAWTRLPRRPERS